MTFKEFNKGEYLYQRGDTSPNFYFMLKGKIELVSESSQQQELKFSKNVDEFEFFGMRQAATDTRGDHARAASESCWVIIINKE